MDQYLYKKYKFTNITCLGTKDGTSKTTQGTPDTYVELENRKYILIMYGAVASKAFNKLKEDITDAYNINKTYIEENKIEKVICCYTSNNINISQRKDIFDEAGVYRDYNFTKKEWALNGDTVIYAPFDTKKETLEYDFDQEKNFSYK